MINATDTITLNIPTPKLNEYSQRQMYADVYCQCCGRGIANRENAWVAQVSKSEKNGYGLVTFSPPPADWKGRDPVEWGSFIGPHCQKLLPKTHKLSSKRVHRYSNDWA